MTSILKRARDRMQEDLRQTTAPERVALAILRGDLNDQTGGSISQTRRDPATRARRRATRNARRAAR